MHRRLPPHWSTLAIGGLLALACSHASADNLRVPKAPETWRTECAGCHVAYPPKLLSATQWKTVMQDLQHHYGTDATLSATEVAQITPFLLANAGQHRDRTPRATLPRITQTDWFVRKHREVPTATWQHPQVKRANNCNACHTRAQEGRFSEHEISIPGLKGQSW